jgi:ribosomal protein S18 acetylase RimI-like enzyme
MNQVSSESVNEPETPSCLIFRRLVGEDVELLQRISNQTFSDAFSTGNDPENLRLFIETAYSRQKLLDELSDPDASFWLLEIDSLPAGYIMTRMKKADVPDSCTCGEMIPAACHTESAETVFELERIYILTAHQGKGYGKLLMDKAVAMAEKAGFRKMRLGVWQKNSRAIAFYKREGFRIAGSKTFLVGNDLQHDWIMERDVSRAMGQTDSRS